MIWFGDQLIIKAICPDCQIPMGIMERPVHGGIGYASDTAFACVTCGTLDCINQGFVTTIEKISGKVIHTSARYVYESSTSKWKPVYPQCVDKHGEKVL